ncbi:MAG: HAMP domain-containing histidine kinase [Chloroflexi bacterium]|nr:MAG: HAMP domain-containing histidine kinase [Chloroflexota bacterium]
MGLRLPGVHADGRRSRPAGPREARRREDLGPEHPDGVGRRLPAGAGGELSLRLRLLAAAAGIVAVSLLLSGALTWVLVRDLELQSAQQQLDRSIVNDRALVLHDQCLVRTGAVTNAGAATCRLDEPLDYTQRLSILASQLGTNRLLLLNSQFRVVFDSGSQDTAGQVISVSASKRVAGVAEARINLGGQTYLVAATAITPARDPLTPLGQLAGAAEDIAAGHYSRRVGIRGTDEIGTLGTAFDRMAEAVERARKVQREFLANVSHELKTPLTSLIGFSQALVDGSLATDLERSRAATVVHEESERVLRMAQELLDLARVEAGSISIHITAVDLRSQLEQEMAIVRPRADARDLALELAVPPDIPPVAADPERLHQILDNLMDNAVKYAPSGSKVIASARFAGGSVEAVVSNPAGPHRPDPDRLFERFYRADPARSAAAGGVGLGLAISRELATAMGGKLWADIDASGDLRVHLALPAAKGLEAKPQPATAA